MCLIGVPRFGINATILNDIFEGIIHITSIAAFITLRTYSTSIKLTIGQSNNVVSVIVGWLAYVPEQSTRFCSERETSFPVALKCCPSRDPVALKAQQEPQLPYN